MESPEVQTQSHEAVVRKHGCLTSCMAIVITSTLLLSLLVYVLYRLFVPTITNEELSTAVITTLARESSESFLVTGTLTFATTVESSSEYTFLPGILNLDLGTTTARVRAPGRVSYGFDVSTIEATDISYSDDEFVEIEMPTLAIFSVEPALEDVEIETEVGWARLYQGSGREREQAALREIRPRMRAAAEQHLETDPTRPRINTAKALVAMLSPALESAGVDDPHFRFRFPTGAVLELHTSDLEEGDLR